MERQLELPDGRRVTVTGDTPEQLRSNAARVMQRYRQAQTPGIPGGPSTPNPQPPQPSGPSNQIPVPTGTGDITYDPAMGPRQAFGTGFINQGTMNFANDILRAVGKEEEAAKFEQNVRKGQSQHPIYYGLGELAGGIVGGLPLSLGAGLAGLAGGPVRNFLGSLATGAGESMISQIGANDEGGRFENVPEAGLWGAGFGALGHTAANLTLGAGQLAGNVIPYFKNLQREQKAYSDIGRRFAADGVNPNQVMKELKALGDEAVIADLPLPRTIGLAEDVVGAPGVRTQDFKEQLDLRRERRSSRATPLLRYGAEQEARSIIQQATDLGLTTTDVPGANYQGLRQLSKDLRAKSEENRVNSFIAGIREDEYITPVGGGKPVKRKGGPVPTDVQVGSWVDDFLEENTYGKKAYKLATDAIKNKHGDAARRGQKGRYSLEFLDKVRARLEYELGGMSPDHPDKADLAEKVREFNDILLNKAQMINVEPTVKAGTSNGGLPVSTAFREPAATPGVPKYKDAIAGMNMANELDAGLDVGIKLASGASPRDLNAAKEMIDGLTPMQRQAATVSFMEGLLDNIKKMKPNSDINAALRNTEAHRDIFNQLSGDPGATAVAFDQIMDIAKREADFERTARRVGISPMDLEKSKLERLKSSTARTALMPTLANKLTFALNVMNSVADKRMNPKVAAKVAGVLFNKDISEDQWKLIQDGFEKSGSMIRLKRMLARATAGAVGGEFGPTEGGF